MCDTTTDTECNEHDSTTDTTDDNIYDTHDDEENVMGEDGMNDAAAEDGDTDIEAAIYEYYNEKTKPQATISTIAGMSAEHDRCSGNLFGAGVNLGGGLQSSSAASTDNEVGDTMSPTHHADGGMITSANYPHDSNYSSVFSSQVLLYALQI